MQEKGKIKLTKSELQDALCRMCTWPEDYRYCPVYILNNCAKCDAVAGITCKKTGLENLTIFEEM